jgi:O-antigen/teichoic acid export membrane protein
MPTRVDDDSPVRSVGAAAEPRHRPLSLRHNFSWTLAGNLVYAACQWAMLVVLAKLGTAEKVGQFALGLAVTAPIIQFSNLQLRGVQATDAREEFRFPDYVALRLLMTLAAMVVIVGVAYFAGYAPQTAYVILAVGLAKAFESISDVFYGLMQRHERMDRVAQSLLIKGPLSLAALGAGVYLTGSVLWGSVGLALAWLIVLVAYDIRSGALILGSYAQLRPKWDRSVLWSLAVLAAPLGVVMTLISLNTNVPRYFIERYAGVGELGIYAAITYLMIAGSTVVVALGQSASPRLARNFADGDTAAFSRLMLKLVAVGFLLGTAGLLVAFFAGPQLLTLLYKPEYARAAPVFNWAMLAALFTYMALFVGYGLTAARRFKVQMPLFATVCAATAVACLVFVPRYGSKGAAWALLVGAVIQCVGASLLLVQALRSEEARRRRAASA